MAAQASPALGRKRLFNHFERITDEPQQAEYANRVPNEIPTPTIGLDHCEARSWHAWHRHMSLVMAAAAFLAKVAADMRRAAMASGKPNNTSPPATIAA